MTTTFTGEVRIPGAIENGLPSTITLDAQTLVLTAGGTELGRWNRADLKLRREPDGSFHLTLGREVVLFNPDSPLEFAILSGMPGPGTAPAPAAAPAESPPAAPEPAPAAPPAAPAQPVVTPPEPGAPASQPAPVTPPPAQPQPAAAPPQPAAAPPPAVTPPPPAASPSTPPPAAPMTPPPAAVPPAAAAAPTTTAAPDPAPAPAPAPPPATAPPVNIQLEQAEAAPPPAPSQAPAAAAPQAPAAQQPQGEGSQDFWDGFHAEQQQATEQGTAPAAPSAAAAARAAAVEAAVGSGFSLETEGSEDDTEPRVGGYGSGLFTEDDERPVHPPAFSGGDDSGQEERGWSYYEDDEDEDTDRGWSYDDPDPEEEPEEAPAFRSPVADSEELVGSSRGSRFAAIAGWRPSLPSFSMGSSGLGMRARGALSVLDAILEENGTDDIPRSFIIGLSGFAMFLGLIAVLVVLFG